MMIKDMPVSSKPREKALLYGVSNLSLGELLAIILRTGYKNKSAIDLANEVINELDSFNNYKEITATRIAKIKGVGMSKSLAILSSIEFGSRLSKNKLNDILLNSSDKIFGFFEHYFDNSKQEEFIVVLLDHKKRLIGYKSVFKGLLNSVNIHPREVFKYAIINSASSIVVIHNHPSGDISPSLEDINVTKNLVEVGKILQIPLIDHLIIGINNYYSFYSEGLNINEKN